MTKWPTTPTLPPFHSLIFIPCKYSRQLCLCDNYICDLYCGLCCGTELWLKGMIYGGWRCGDRRRFTRSLSVRRGWWPRDFGPEDNLRIIRYAKWDECCYAPLRLQWRSKPTRLLNTITTERAINIEIYSTFFLWRKGKCLAFINLFRNNRLYILMEIISGERHGGRQSFIAA